MITIFSKTDPSGTQMPKKGLHKMGADPKSCPARHLELIDNQLTLNTLLNQTTSNYNMIMQSYLFKSILAITAATSLNSCSDSASTSTTKPVISKTQPAATKTVSTYSKKVGKDKHGMATYSDGSRTRYVRATAYSHMEKEPGAPGRKTAAGTTLKYGSKLRSVAADWSRLPLGTKFKIKGQPNITYLVEDYGSALVGTNTIDMFFPTLRGMNRWGTRKVTIQIIQMGSWERSARLLKGRTKYKHCAKMYYAIKKKLNAKPVAKNN